MAWEMPNIKRRLSPDEETWEIPLLRVTGPSFCTTASERVYITDRAVKSNWAEPGGYRLSGRAAYSRAPSAVSWCCTPRATAQSRSAQVCTSFLFVGMTGLPPGEFSLTSPGTKIPGQVNRNSGSP
jgi:hypothetical protein